LGSVCAKRALKFLPGVGIAREERLANVKSLAVVVGVQEPGNSNWNPEVMFVALDAPISGLRKLVIIDSSKLTPYDLLTQ
jgi:hypothetical protein